VNFEERLGRLVERHQALSQSVEMLLAAARENTENIAALVRVTNQDAEAIRPLVRIVETHDHLGD